MGIWRHFLVFFAIILTSLAVAQSSDEWYRLLTQFRFKSTEQAYCFRDDSGAIHGRNIDKKVMPASVTKLYVTYYTMRKVGSRHRYKTTFHYKDGHLHIRGGQDNFFTTEVLYYVLGQLNDNGITHVDKLTFDSNFYFNWTRPDEGLAGLLKGYVNTANWNPIHQLEFDNLEFQITRLGLNMTLPPVLDFTANQVWKKDDVDLRDFEFKMEFHSSPVYEHLKQMNIYSTNFIAWNLFNDMGGQEEFAKFMLKEFQVGPETIEFENGAGFEPNLTTCRMTIYLIEDLKRLIAKEGLTVQQLISVPGEDFGTLGERYQNEYKKTLVAKTGTLRHTSTLAGLLKTEAKSFAFGIFNHTYRTVKAREFQDLFVPVMFDHLGMPDTYDYERADYIPLMDAIFESDLEQKRGLFQAPLFSLSSQ